MHKKTEAKLQGSMLTVGFHAAKAPLIWRFDLKANPSFTMSMQGDEGDWELGVTLPKGDFFPVAHFTEREASEEALYKVEKALSNKGRAVNAVLKAVALVGILAVAIALVVAINLVVPPRPHQASVGTETVPVQAPAAAKDGVPQSADDVLQPPR